LPLPEESAQGMDLKGGRFGEKWPPANDGGYAVAGIFMRAFVPDGVGVGRIWTRGTAFHEGEPYS